MNLGLDLFGDLISELLKGFLRLVRRIVSQVVGLNRLATLRVLFGVGLSLADQSLHLVVG